MIAKSKGLMHSLGYLRLLYCPVGNVCPLTLSPPIHKEICLLYFTPHLHSILSFFFVSGILMAGEYLVLYWVFKIKLD